MPDRLRSQSTSAEAPTRITIDQKKPWAFWVSGTPPTFMPKIPAIKLAGKNTVVTMAST